jgi:hypothetical protein
LPLTKSQQKRADHKEKFKRIGAALNTLSVNQIAWRDHLGDHQFKVVSKSIEDKAVSSRMYGPQTKSQQFIRTVRKGQ